MANTLKEKMKRGEKVIGTFTHIGGNVAVELLGLAGLDFVVIDTEHAPFSNQSVMDYVIASEVRGITPVVRVADHTRASLHRPINSGAKSLIIPCMETVAEAKLLSEQCKFYPTGRHCFPYSRNSSWGRDSAGRLTDFFDEQNDDILIMPQCETVGFLDNLEEILAMKAIDGVFVGPFDLSTDMGVPGQFGDPKMVAAREKILRCCKEAGKFAWIFSPNAEAGKQNLADGFDGTAISMDTVVYADAFKKMVADVHGK